MFLYFATMMAFYSTGIYYGGYYELFSEYLCQAQFGTYRHNSVLGNYISLFCHDDGSLLHIRIILWRLLCTRQ